MVQTQGDQKKPSQNAQGEKELQERWVYLELKPETLLHLQQVLDTYGVPAAMVITDVLVREAERRRQFAEQTREWFAEIFHQVALEGLQPVLINLVRIVLGVILAWHLISLPFLSDAMPDTVLEMVMATLFLLISVIRIALVCRFRCIRAGVNTQRAAS